MTSFFGMTDIGLKRQTNQDSFYAGYITPDVLLCAVCDGMGGANGGSVASRLAVDEFYGSIKQSLEKNPDADALAVMSHAVNKANMAVYEKSLSDKELSGMGTTLVSALFDGQKVYFASVGDSRIYVIKQNVLYQLSHDHSYVQTLVDSGQITESEARVHPNRNIITKAVGINGELECDLFVMDKENMDGVLLCSDGLCGYVEEQSLNEVLKTCSDPGELVVKYVDMALDEGGADNITAVAVKLVKDTDIKDTSAERTVR